MDHDHCTGIYAEELDCKYNKSMSRAQFLECLPAEQIQLTVTASANAAYVLYGICVEQCNTIMISTVIN